MKEKTSERMLFMESPAFWDRSISSSAAFLFAILASSNVYAMPVDLLLTSDWEVEVVLNNHPEARKSKFAIAPLEFVKVTHERVEQLAEWKEQPGWARRKIPGLMDGMCSARFVLDGDSLVVKSSPEPDATIFENLADYRADVEWSGIGRIVGGRIKPEQAVYLSYRFQQRRLDTVILTPEGEIRLRQGSPHISMPKPPDLKEGERRLANIWLPENTGKLQRRNLFPIHENSYPELPSEQAADASKLIPKTMVKLVSGAPLKILAWGDSVTEGYLGDDQWQLQFLRRIQQRYPKAEIAMITIGWGARNSDDFLQAPPGHSRNFAETVLACRPDLVISNFGNDNPLPMETNERNYETFLAKFRKIGAEWIIVTPHLSSMMGLDSERDIADDPRPYVQMLRRFAAENQLALADAAARYGRLWLQGIPFSTLMVNTANHPDARGMKIFADSLMALFPEQSPASATAP